MPGFDGTGPLGAGSMTGRGRGYCMLPVQGITPCPTMYRRPGYWFCGRPRLGLALRRGWRGCWGRWW